MDGVVHPDMTSATTDALLDRQVGQDTPAPADATQAGELSPKADQAAPKADQAGPKPDAPTDLGKPPSTNLLVNAGCELGTTTPGNVVGWTAVTCQTNWSCYAQKNFINPPQAGTLLFFAGPCTPAELYQDVDVSNLAPWIDKGQQKFEFSGWVSTWLQQKDSSRFIVEYRPGSGAPLTTYDSGPIAVPLPWKEVSDVRTAPVGTRSIRVRLLAVRAEGTQNDGYFDSLSLIALP